MTEIYMFILRGEGTLLFCFVLFPLSSDHMELKREKRIVFFPPSSVPARSELDYSYGTELWK